MKIGLVGTVSVGKTTLVNALKELPQFKDYHFATERSKYLRDLGIPLNTDSTLKGQTMFLAERVSELMQDSLITDRTIRIKNNQNMKGIKDSILSLFLSPLLYFGKFLKSCFVKRLLLRRLLNK